MLRYWRLGCQLFVVGHNQFITRVNGELLKNVGVSLEVCYNPISVTDL